MDNVNPTELIVCALRDKGLSSDQILELMIKGGFQMKTADDKVECVENSFEEDELLTDKQKENKLKDFLLKIGMPRHLIGYSYTVRAVLLYEKNPTQGITKELYPTVAKEFKSTTTRVERAIRHAIECAWDRCPIEIMEKYFGSTILWKRGKPSNSEFIAMCAEWLGRDQ